MTPRVKKYAYQIGLATGIAPGLILSRDTSHAVAQARWRLMARLRQDGFSTTQIGRWLGRDHSTVVHGLRRQYELSA